MLDDGEELKPPTYSIQYSGEATDWGQASNDNKASHHHIPTTIIWYAAVAAAGASAYFLF